MEIFEHIPSDAWQAGAVGMLGVAFLLILFGGLVPSRFYKELKQERDMWRAVALKQQGHTEALLPAAHAQVEFVHGLTAALSGVTDLDDSPDAIGPGGEGAA